jgi:hypothetical protein
VVCVDAFHACIECALSRSVTPEGLLSNSG